LVQQKPSQNLANSSAPGWIIGGGLVLTCLAVFLVGYLVGKRKKEQEYYDEE
jgi:hypothetical protein